MASKCDFKISASVGYNCDNPVVMGCKGTGWIMNYEDVDFDDVTHKEDNYNVVTNLVLKKNAKAYKVFIPGNTPFTGTTTEFSSGTYRNGFNKTVSLVILDNGAEVADKIIDQLANGQFVVVLENKYQGGDKTNTFEIYGLEQGLTATALTNEKYSEETQGGWAVTLQETNAPSSAMYFFKEDVKTTRMSLESLVSGFGSSELPEPLPVL